MSVKVKFFASLADVVGARDATCEYAPSMTVSQVWSVISSDKDLPNGMLCARNQAYCDLEDSVEDGDEVAFFPPATGG
ncbi:MAG: MoaD/ThiS family protein [Pseudomonadota bacterium]